MTIKEIRVGNRLNYDSFGYEVAVMGVCSGGKAIDLVLLDDISSLGGRVPITSVSPIELTEEKLLDFKFFVKFQDDMFDEGRFTLQENGSKYYSWVKGCFNLEIQPNGEIWFEVYSHYIHIQYVHQLQNLYYFLVGEELI